MDFEKRTNLRRPLKQTAAILRSDGSLVCECTLRDVSATGARIAMTVQAGAAIPEVPAQFILSLSRSGNVVRYCETIWQRANEIGARFTERKEANILGPR